MLYIFGVIDSEHYSVTDLTVTPDENWNGDLTVPVFVTDQTISSDTLDMIITVNPVNDAPVLNSVTNQATDEDTPITLDLSMVTTYDVDGDSLNIVVLSGNNYSVTDSTVTPDENWNGDLTVAVYVNDQSENSNTLNMTITVKPINDAPVLSSVTDQITDEDIPITLDITMVTVSDIDGDKLNIVVLDSVNYSVTDSTVTPDANYNGDLTVPVYVTDQTANSDTLDMTINVGSTGFDDDINNSGITIYPNPVKNIINVNYDKEFSMEIYNVLGEIILISKHAETNVSSLPTGIYIIIIKDKENKLIKYKKVVKE